MTTESLLFAGLIGLLLLGLLFFAALADAALRAINQVRLRSLLEQGVRRAEAVNRLLDHPHRITATTLIIGTFALSGLAALTTLVALRVSPRVGPERWVMVAAVLLVGLVVLIFGQLIPRALALRWPERTAVRITRPLTALYVVISPIAWTAERIANGVVRLFGVKDAPRNPFITEDDLQMLVNAGEEEGVIEEEEREMITGILRFGDTEAHEVMVPRPDIVAVPEHISPREALETAMRAGHSRLPVYEDTIDSITGVVYVKDLVLAAMSGQNRPLSDLARPALFIPETKNLAELLHDLQTSRIHMAIVADEYGGTAGVVTIEDVLEEIVGEIEDEYDPEETPDAERVGADEWILRGRMDLDDVNELLGLALNSDDYDTLGGFITARLERLPVEGDELDVQGVRLTVLDVERNRIGRVRVCKVGHVPEPEDAG